MLGNIEQEKEAIVAEVEPLRELKTGIDEIARHRQDRLARCRSDKEKRP